MKNFCLVIISVLLLPVIYFSSCAKVDENNVSRPVVSDIRFNENDTIAYWDGEIRRSLRFNDSLNFERTIDTLIPGKWLNVSANLFAEGKLSTFIIRGKVTYNSHFKYAEPNVDSIFEIVRLGQDIYDNKKDCTMIIKNRLLIIPDTIRAQRYFRSTTKTVMDTLVIKMDQLYDISVILMDQFGNLSDSVNEYRQVKFMTREQLLEARGKK